MRVRRRYLSLGIFLLCLGAVPLAVDLGFLSPSVAADLTRLWPLVLIGLGVGVMLRFSAVEWLGGMVVAGTFGLLIGTALAGGLPGIGCVSDQVSGSTVMGNGTYSGGVIDVDVSCADLTVDNWATDNTWSVQATTEQPPTINGDGGLTLHSSRTVGLPFAGGRERWMVSLPSQLANVPTMSYFHLSASHAQLTFGPGSLNHISIDVNAGDANVDLHNVDMTHGPLNMTLNAASANLDLPTSGLGATGTVHVNASSLTICADPGLALRFNYDETLGSNDFASAGLTGSGDTWTTPGYDSAAAHVELNLSANLSSISLSRPSGGCAQ
jgi:hypothetical protein